MGMSRYVVYGCVWYYVGLYGSKYGYTGLCGAMCRYIWLMMKWIIFNCGYEIK